MMRLVALAVLLAACGTRPCKEHTVLVTLTLDGASTAADHAELAFTIGGGTPQTQMVALSGHSTTIEVDFGSGYPAGKSLAVHVVAEQDGVAVGTGDGTVELGGSCEPLAVAVGSSSDAGASDLSASDGGSDLGGCGIVYVSTTGHDGNDGCSSMSPVATIAHGIAIASSGAEVHVCAGQYLESGLSVSGVVLGGYSCTTWARVPAYGYPGFDATNRTLVISSSQASIVTIPSGATKGTMLDGFDIVGGATSTAPAVLALGPALISNNQITGGGGTASTGNASTGVEADGDEEITQNAINGGNGALAASSETGVGSIGLHANPTSVAPRIHDNVIGGGTGTARTLLNGSIGLLLEGAAAFTVSAGTEIRNNTIYGNTGTGASGAIGLSVVGTADVDVVGCSISSTEALDMVAGSAVGVNLASSGAVHVFQNRISGGMGGETIAVRTFGIATSGTNTIESNMIHTGFAMDPDAPVSVGVDIFQMGTRVIHNTLIGSNGSGSVPLVRISPSGIMGVVIDDNILAGGASSATVGIQAVQSCLADDVTSIHDNVTFNTALIATSEQSGVASCSSAPSYTSDEALETDLGATAGGNLNLASTCTADTGCVVVPACTPSAPQACLDEIFANIDDGVDGASVLFGAGWVLTDQTPCAVAVHAPTTTTQLELDADLYGKTWPMTPSMGADEHPTCGM